MRLHAEPGCIRAIFSLLSVQRRSVAHRLQSDLNQLFLCHTVYPRRSPKAFIPCGRWTHRDATSRGTSLKKLVVRSHPSPRFTFRRGTCCRITIRLRVSRAPFAPHGVRTAHFRLLMRFRFNRLGGAWPTEMSKKPQPYIQLAALGRYYLSYPRIRWSPG